MHRLPAEGQGPDPERELRVLPSASGSIEWSWTIVGGGVSRFEGRGVVMKVSDRLERGLDGECVVKRQACRSANWSARSARDRSATRRDAVRVWSADFARPPRRIFGQEAFGSPRYSLFPEVFRWHAPVRSAARVSRSATRSRSAARPSISGGVGTKITGITRRKFKPNLQRLRVTSGNGTNATVLVCTQCLKSGKVTKLVQRKPFHLPKVEKAKPAAEEAVPSGPRARP